MKKSQSISHFKLFYETAQTILSSSSLQLTLETLVERCVAALGVKGGSLRLVDEQTHQLEQVASSGLSDAYLNKGALSSDRSVPQVLSGEVVCIQDAFADPRIQYRDELKAEGINTMLSLPLEASGASIGVLRLYSAERREFSAEEIRADLSRRATGKSRHTSQRREKDDVQILSGVFEGRTTGTPIALVIENTDARSRDYENIKRQFRPGHADYTYWKKYGMRDYRGGGRSSARETTMRVAAGVIAKKWLRAQFGTEIQGWLAQLGPHRVDARMDWDEIERNPFFCPDPDMVPVLEDHMDALRKSGDSNGARVNVIARNVPAGLGAPVYGKLDADLASAMMSINAAKGVEIGAGFDSVTHYVLLPEWKGDPLQDYRAMAAKRAPALRRLWMVPGYVGASMTTTSPGSSRTRAARFRPCCEPEVTRSCSG